MDVDVVVVGAGLAGLAAAAAVREDGFDVAVLEARERVGGRTLTSDLDGVPIDLGAQWIGPTQDRMAALVSELGLRSFPTHAVGDHLLDHDGQQRRWREAPPLGAAGLADVVQAGWRLERMARDVPLDRPWAAPRARSWDAQTFETWVARTARTARGRLFFRVLAPAVFATETANLSLLHVLFYLRAAGGLEPLVALTGGAQQDRIVGGAQQVAVRLAERLEPRVQLGAPVRRIGWTDSGAVVTHDRGAVRARRVIVAVPPTVAGRIAYAPAMPADRDQLTQRAPHGAVTKVHIVYAEPFWRAAGLSGLAVSGTGPVLMMFDNSPPDGSPGILVAFLEGAHALGLARAAPAERRRVVLAGASRCFGPLAAAPVDYVEHDWQAEEWTRGCYGAHLPPGAWTQVGPALRRPVGPIHWAGTETATVWAGYMEGAVESGRRAAVEVTAALRRG